MFKRRVNNDDRFFFYSCESEKIESTGKIVVNIFNFPALFSANFPCLQKEITGI